MSADEDSRRYSDEEIAEILRQALQPRAGSGLPAPATEGLSLSELERVASEAGIDPARVREAALQLPAETEDQGGSPIFGPRASHVFERIVEGEIEEDRFADVIAGIRRQTRNRGNVQEYSDWAEWRSDAGEITAERDHPRTGDVQWRVEGPRDLRAYRDGHPDCHRRDRSQPRHATAGAWRPVLGRWVRSRPVALGVGGASVGKEVPAAGE